MVSNNVLQRTFRIRYGGNEGTCFTIDQDRKQYVVTAKHIISGFDSGTIEIFYKKKWNQISFKLVGVTSPPIDIAVLALSFQLSPNYPLPTNAEGIFLSQDVYFIGFPFGLYIDVEPNLNRDFPLPLVKKGIVSSFGFSDKKLDYLLLDGYINPGFSGGPVVYIPLGTTDQIVAGVISGNYIEWKKVYDQDQPTVLRCQQNAGIILAYSIQHAIEIIKMNPIGFPLSKL